MRYPLWATLFDDTATLKQTHKDRLNANPSQNKKSCNQPHKPTQIAAHFILPNRSQAHPPPDFGTTGNLKGFFDNNGFKKLTLPT